MPKFDISESILATKSSDIMKCFKFSVLHIMLRSCEWPKTHANYCQSCADEAQRRKPDNLSSVNINIKLILTWSVVCLSEEGLIHTLLLSIKRVSAAVMNPTGRQLMSTRVLRLSYQNSISTVYCVLWLFIYWGVHQVLQLQKTGIPTE